jgi:hypothetical protein
MKSPVLAALACAVFLGCLGNLSAQFYAPNTEYHDPVQRVFPVEAARVLAWWEDPSGTNLAELTYEVTTKPGQSTSWEIRWLAPGGKLAKSKTVSYEGDLLKAGPEFYRSVFKQLWSVGWNKPKALSPQEATRLFWQGAARMGLSREKSLEAAMVLINRVGQDPQQDWIPELAGLLTHAALPGFAEQVTLDKLLVARGAAWLALSETECSAKLDALWTPVLFQARREPAAAQAWTNQASSKPDESSPQKQGWDLWVRAPSSKELFLFATDTMNLPMAMPMLAHDVAISGTGKTLADLIMDLTGSSWSDRSPGKLIALHNYAPLFATKTGIMGGRILEGTWPVYGRLAWLHLLSAYTPMSYDYQGYSKTLAEVSKAVSKPLAQEQELDPSLAGLRETAPLLNLGHTEGIGKLVPVAVTTSRDLLNYGWEMTGWQMGARYNFVQYRWSVRELAEPIYRLATTEVEGLMPFFRRLADAHVYNYPECLRRLEMVEGLYYLAGFSPPPADTNEVTLAGTHLLVKRCWLRVDDFEWQARALWDANAIAEIADLIQTLRDQGGYDGRAKALAYLVQLNDQALQKIPNGLDLKYNLAESLPYPTPLKAQGMFDRKFGKLDSFARAQEYEKWYWSNPACGLEDRLIYNYIQAGAFKAARHFYLQARGTFEDPVKFANNSGMDLYVVGLCLHDEGLRQDVLKDSACGSHSDMLMNIWEAASRDKPKEIEASASEMVERYEQNQGMDSLGRRLLKFLPLLPALRDVKHPSRREALEYFGKEPAWTMLRFIWIEKFKLPTADAIVLLGGRENDALRRLIISYLEKDEDKAGEAFAQIFAKAPPRHENMVLAACLHSRLRASPHAEEIPELKPAGARSISQVVREKLKASGRLVE